MLAFHALPRSAPRSGGTIKIPSIVSVPVIHAIAYRLPSIQCGVSNTNATTDRRLDFQHACCDNEMYLSTYHLFRSWLVMKKKIRLQNRSQNLDILEKV